MLPALLLAVSAALSDDDTPNDNLYSLLWADANATAATLKSKARKTITLFSPQQKPQPERPNVEEAAHLVPLITDIKRVLANPFLRMVYDGFSGIRRFLNWRHRCVACTLIVSTGRPVK